MDVLNTENSNDSTDKIKEKVRVVSLEDPSIIASDFGANSNSSVWSLCGLNSDDHHVDLGDISPSISPLFTEQQMADHLSDRLMADEDHVFSGEHASESTLSENSRSLPDLQSDLEAFDREMEDLESLDSSNDFKPKKDGDSVKNEESLAGKQSPKKRGATDTSTDDARKGAGIALRTRNRRRGQQTSEVNDAKQADEKEEVPKVTNKDHKELINSEAQRKTDSNLSKTAQDTQKSHKGKKVTQTNNTDELQSTARDLPESPKEKSKDTKETADLKSSEPTKEAPSPDKRVTRSTTGNLKPKQMFDEIQLKVDLIRAKRKEANAQQSKQKKDGKVDDQSEAEGKGKVDEKPAVKEKKSGQQETDHELSSDDEEIDFHEDDSDYCPEDDPDRLWCICKKPHGNKFMICCDGCEEWFHGKCVGITMQQGKVMEKQGKEYVCEKCKEKKARELSMAEKAKELAEAIKTMPDTTTQESPKKPKPKRKIISTDIVTEPDSSESPTQVSAPSQSDEVKKRKVKEKEPAGFKIPKKVRTTPTPVSHSHVQAPRKCIVEGCPRTSFEGAVYCGRSCIERHVNEAVKMLSSKEHGGKLHTSEGNRVSMIEKSSGRLVAGMAAPVVTHLTEWILKNPSFQVLVSGTSPTTHSPGSFYNKVNAESKHKKESDKKNEEDTVRNNVRRMMKDILVERKKESVEIRISLEEIMKLVRRIEEDMYKAFKDTSHRYKAKYRTLMFNLKDPRNKVLYKRVLTGDIPPDKLIWMTSDELATKELAQWREQETKHMIDMIKKEEEITNKARLIKKTHKGEVDVDGAEDLSTLEATNIKEVEEKKPKTEEKVEVAIVDTTEEHRAHLFDLNCKICTGKMAPPGEVVAKSPTMSNVPVQAAAESSIPSPPPSQESSTYIEPLSPDSRDTTTDFSNLTEKSKESSVWKGFVMMQSVAKFGTNAFLVTGAGDNLIQVLPDTLHVAGRIPHKHVWEYVKQCRNSSSRELCIIRFAAATDEEKISYVSLYSYFHSRKRCGVIGNCHSAVKDMYLVPLAAHEPIPPPLLPFNGPGLQEPRPHMLLGLIVKNKNAPIKRSRSGSDRALSKTEPPAKRASVDDPSSKSSTPTAQAPVKPSDSPVDEIEDIVFHYHNTQGGKPEPVKTTQGEPAKAAQQTSIPPMISALLKIQEQEKRLRELQKQSELLEKELAPKVGNVPAPTGSTQMAGSSGLAGYQMQGSVGASNVAAAQVASSVPTQLPAKVNAASALVSAQKAPGAVSNVFSAKTVGQPSQAKSVKNLGFPAVIQQSTISSTEPLSSVDGPKSSSVSGKVSVEGTQPQVDENEPYDPETADNEETPYDPEDMDAIDLSLDEAPSPEKGSAVLTQPKIEVTPSQNPTPSNIINPSDLAAINVVELLKQSALLSSIVVKPEMQGLVKPEGNKQLGLTSGQRSIPKELEEKVQALLKPEQGNLAKQTNNEQAGKPEASVLYGEQRVNRGDLPQERSDPYNHSRDFHDKRDFEERREFSERRESDPKFYSSRFSLSARRSDGREGHDRGGLGKGYDRDYKSRDHRDGGDRGWDDRGRDRGRGDYYNRNRDRHHQRDRNWRR